MKNNFLSRLMKYIKSKRKLKRWKIFHLNLYNNLKKKLAIWILRN